jgi:hypothetical protein
MQLQQRLNCPIKVIVDNKKQRSTFSLLLTTVLGLNTPITLPDIPFQDHDRFILVAPIWAGRIAGPMQTFIRRYKSRLTTVSFATICGGQPGQREKIYRQLTRLTGKDPASLLELQLKHLLAAQNPPSAPHAGNYRMQPADWAFFDEPITRFAADLDPTIGKSRSTQVAWQIK